MVVSREGACIVLLAIMLAGCTGTASPGAEVHSAGEDVLQLPAPAPIWLNGTVAADALGCQPEASQPNIGEQAESLQTVSPTLAGREYLGPQVSTGALNGGTICVYWLAQRGTMFETLAYSQSDLQETSRGLIPLDATHYWVRGDGQIEAGYWLAVYGYAPGAEQGTGPGAPAGTVPFK